MYHYMDARLDMAATCLAMQMKAENAFACLRKEYLARNRKRKAEELLTISSEEDDDAHCEAAHALHHEGPAHCEAAHALHHEGPARCEAALALRYEGPAHHDSPALHLGSASSFAAQGQGASSSGQGASQTLDLQLSASGS